MSGIKVWLDDNRPAPEGWRLAQTIEQVKVWLIQGAVEELSLDHDLDNPPCPTCDFKCGYRDDGTCGKGCACHAFGDEDGRDLLRWMCDWHLWPQKKPVVHSTAGRHAEEMKNFIDQNFPG